MWHRRGGGEGKGGHEAGLLLAHDLSPWQGSGRAQRPGGQILHGGQCGKRAWGWLGWLPNSPTDMHTYMYTSQAGWGRHSAVSVSVWVPGGVGISCVYSRQRSTWCCTWAGWLAGRLAADISHAAACTAYGVPAGRPSAAAGHDD